MTTRICPPYQIKVSFSKRASNSSAMRRELAGHGCEPETVWVIEHKFMTRAEYRHFERDFFQLQYWINKYNSRPAHCVAVEAPGYPILYVRPEGHAYARYVGLAAVD
ncbi:hypothetical protein [Lysobacter sp. ESA13C]|uniref:hypothetical protein n=1 Tax=Lysobacter sp. ESA13C TaxID=2862676 RepID=UPI001CBD24DF|nr:hypothetical protein [Lysobacter sp. ESA13C]